VCWMHSEEERRSDRAELAVSLRVADISSSRCVAPRRSSYRYGFLVAPCGDEKSLATRLEGILKMGSQGPRGHGVSAPQAP
jgi:hypothetical protein